RTRFNAEMKDGKFAERETHGMKHSLRYIEENGDRYIEETRLGKIISYRKGKLIGNIFINLIHLALWFLVIWLLLRFQWAHALGFAVIFWLVATLSLVPFLLDKSRRLSERTAPSRKASAALALPVAAS